MAAELAEIVVLRPTVNEQAARAARPLLSAFERRHAARFFDDADRFRHMVVCARRRQLLASRLGIPPEEIAIVRGPHGKPALAKGAPADLRFNTSYSRGLAAFAFAPGREVGIDVEALEPVPDVDVVAERVLSAAERSAYLELDSRDRLLGFYQAWTRKEALTKAIGHGLTAPLDEFDVSFGPDEPARIMRIGNTPGDRCGWRLWSFVPAPGFIGALVVAELTPVVCSAGCPHPVVPGGRSGAPSSSSALPEPRLRQLPHGRAWWSCSWWTRCAPTISTAWRRASGRTGSGG